MNKYPKVTVIMAVYNSEKYLKECLDSVVNQTLKDMEIICINDGSTDSSLQILEDYANKDSRFRIYTKQNEGLGGASARNYGLTKARGEYVSILDSDDFFDPYMLEKAVYKADELDADIVVFGGFEYDEQTKAKRKVIGILNESKIPDKDVFSCEDIPNTIYQLSQGMAWNKLYRRSFLEKHQIKFQSIKYTDDAYFTFSHMALAERIVVIPEPLINYRINSGRNQTSGIANYPDSSYMPYIKLKESLENWGKYELLKRSFVNCVAGFTRYCYEKIDRFDAFEYLHNKLRDEIFEKLDMVGHPDEYYYDKRVGVWVRQVMKYSVGEILFMSARAHGSSDSTTGILRFLFPYEAIQKNSRLIILGAKIVGQHYYSQALLSGFYDIVLWVDNDNPKGYRSIADYDKIKTADYDYILIDYYEKEKIENALEYLIAIGVSKDRIIIGEDYL